MRFLAVVAALALWIPDAALADQYGLCSGGNRKARKVTCLVDGDTGWENGVKWRMEGIDTPEYPPYSECAAEPEMAKVATYRMLELMQDGYKIIWSGKLGKNKRDLVRIILSDGRDAGHVLLAEDLAQPWPNNSNPWCRSPAA